VNGQSNTTTYTYDDASRLENVIDHLSRTYHFDWDAAGNRQALVMPNGTRTDYTYDGLNRLTNLSTTGPSGVIFSQAFTLFPTGRRDRIDENGGVVKLYGYDTLDRLTSEDVSSNGALSYTHTWTYDAVGNRKKQVTTLGPVAPPSPDLQPGTIDYTLDSRDRLLKEVFSGGLIVNYTWDDNGNLVTKSGDKTMTWDEENHLVRVEKTDGTVESTAYDVDGNRVQTTLTLPSQPTKITNYLVDTSGGLSHAVVESDVTNTLSALYVRGTDDVLSVNRPNTTNTSGWASKFYVADGIGSIRTLTDEAGHVTDTMSTDAFGVLISRTGGDQQPYLFAGEAYDPNVGFQYHRARWLDPRVGRFASGDPMVGDPNEPRSLHRYLYGYNAPLNLLDPSGQSILPRAFWALVGTKAHVVLSVVYALLGATINSPINRPLNDNRPDIRFEQDARLILTPLVIHGTQGEVYEIKSEEEEITGADEVYDYISQLNAEPGNTIFWRPGQRLGFHQEFPGVLVSPPGFEWLFANLRLVSDFKGGGVITYTFAPDGTGLGALTTVGLYIAVLKQALAGQVSTAIQAEATAGAQLGNDEMIAELETAA
jgi:RHS repeat-associated protein